MPSSSSSIAGLFTRALAGCLILSLVQEPAILLAAAAPGWHSKHAPAVHPLTEEERAAQALNRLTFGPRPGDLETNTGDRGQEVGRDAAQPGAGRR